MGPTAQKLTRHSANMRALYWDGHELSFNTSYPSPFTGPKIEDRESKIVGATGSRLESSDNKIALIKVHLVGKRVVGEINFACGKCDSCWRDLGRHCPNRTVMGILNADGAFAEYVSVPTANLHVVPDNLSDEEAVFTEPLAAAFEILTQAQVDPADDVLVLGDGKLGNLCAQVLRLTGAKVTALGKYANKLALIKNVGVRTIPLNEWTPRLFDVVVEASGSASGLELDR